MQSLIIILKTTAFEFDDNNSQTLGLRTASNSYCLATAQLRNVNNQVEQMAIKYS